MRQTPAILGINLLAASFLVGLQLYYNATFEAILWYGALTVFGSVQLNQWDRFRKQSKLKQAPDGDLSKAALLSLSNGIIWGAAPFLLPLDGSIQSSLFLAIVVTGMAAGTFSLLSPMPTIVAAFVVPCMTPILISCLVIGDAATAMLAIMGGVLIFGMIRGARISADYFENMHRFAGDAAVAQTRLGEALDSSGEAIAIFNPQGYLVKANSAFRTQFKGVDRYVQLPGDGAFFNERSGCWSIGKSNETSDGGAIVIHTDISELKIAEQQSQQARMAAEEASRAKTQFLAAVSHELRTPLNAVIGYADLLRRESLGSLGAPEYKEYSAKIGDGGCRLLTLINNIIDLTKFESSSYSLDSARVSTASVIDIVTETLRRSTKDKRQIAVSIEDGAQYIFVDENALKTAVEHVLRNALKYTSPVDEIGIKAMIVNGGPCIQVRDAGEGIPLKYLAQVTEPFLQAQSAYDRDHEGLGLGLAVAQSIMRAHGGSLEIESVEGAGTFVDLKLPAERLIRDCEAGQLRVGT